MPSYEHTSLSANRNSDSHLLITGLLLASVIPYFSMLYPPDVRDQRFAHKTRKPFIYIVCRLFDTAPECQVLGWRKILI